MAGTSRPVVPGTGGAPAPAAFAVGSSAAVVAGVPAEPVATPLLVLGSAAAPATGSVVLVAGVDAGGRVAPLLLLGVSEPQPRFEASAWKAKKVATIGENFINLQAWVEMVVEAN
jgi:hypothetical protein